MLAKGGQHADVRLFVGLDGAGHSRHQGLAEAVAIGARSCEENCVEIKQVLLTSGQDDLIVVLEAPNDDNVAKFAMAVGSLGNVRTRTARAWTEQELEKLISELP